MQEMQVLGWKLVELGKSALFFSQVVGHLRVQNRNKYSRERFLLIPFNSWKYLDNTDICQT